MKFITCIDGTWHLDNYFRYLTSIKALLPNGARQFLFNEWHYNITDHKSPHDSWVDQFSVTEIATGERREVRSLEISVKLLGAFQDTYINITYHNVKHYTVDCDQQKVNFNECAHGDWIIDEIQLTSTGFVSHEIQFSNARWTIVATDIICTHHPYSV